MLVLLEEMFAQLLSGPYSVNRLTEPLLHSVHVNLVLYPLHLYLITLKTDSLIKEIHIYLFFLALMYYLVSSQFIRASHDQNLDVDMHSIYKWGTCNYDYSNMTWTEIGIIHGSVLSQYLSLLSYTLSE